jgi:hypothetical protein
MRLFNIPRGALSLLVVVVTADTLLAQQVPAPPGVIGGLFGGRRPQPDPNRASSRWSITFSGSGGIDEEPIETSPEDPQGQSVSGAAGTVSANSQFMRGRPGRLVDLSAGGFLNRQELQSGQLRGANGRIHGQYDPSQRLSFSGSSSINYQPMTIGAPPAIASDEGPTPAASLGPPAGVDEELWISTMATASVTRGWTPRQRLVVSYTDLRSRPIDSPGLESRSRVVSARESWNATQRLSLRIGYNHSQTTQTGVETGNVPTAIQSATAGFDFRRQLRPTRSIAFIFDAGADYVETSIAPDRTGHVVMPSFSGSVQATLSQRWTFSLGASREASVLPGVSPTPFTTDQASMQISATIIDRLSVSAFGSYSRGAAVEGQRGAFEAGTGTAQFNYGLSRYWSVFGNVTYYDHRLREVNTASGIPPAYGRHTVRVGFSYWLPLYGTF